MPQPDEADSRIATTLLEELRKGSEANIAPPLEVPQIWTKACQLWSNSAQKLGRHRANFGLLRAQLRPDSVESCPTLVEVGRIGGRSGPNLWPTSQTLGELDDFGRPGIGQSWLARPMFGTRRPRSARHRKISAKFELVSLISIMSIAFGQIWAGFNHIRQISATSGWSRSNFGRASLGLLRLVSTRCETGFDLPPGDFKQL